MSYLVFAFGVLLSVCGAAAAYFGYGIVEVERGWSSLIAGVTALSCGVVTIALALILGSLAKLQAFLEAEKGIKPLPKELAEVRAMDASEAPHKQAPDFEPLTDSSGLVPATSAGPVAPTFSPPPAAETFAGGLPLPVERLDLHRGRARMFTSQARESSRGGANASQASIDDVRRLVAAKFKGPLPPEPRFGSGQIRALDASGASKSPPEPGSGAAGEPPRPIDETARFSPASAGAPVGEERQWRPVGGFEAPVDAARAAETEVAARTARSVAPRQAEDGVVFPAGPRPDGGAIGETAWLASEEQAWRAQGAYETAPGGAAEAALSSGSPHAPDEGLAIIGRTESEGTSYVMYADGSIDAHSDRGVFHFKSMADLKAFMESQG